MNIMLAELKEKITRFFYDKLFDKKAGRAIVTASMPDFNKFLIKKAELQKEAALQVGSGIGFLYGEPLLTAQQEYHLFREMNYYKYRIKTSKSLFNAKKYWEKYIKVKTQIASSNVRLVANIAKKQVEYVREPFINTLLNIMSDGHPGLMRAIDYFDYNKGFKFSTYATWAIRDSINRSRKERIKNTGHISTNACEDILFEKEDESRSELTDLHNKQYVESLLNLIDPKQKRILTKIFYQNSKLWEVAEEEGISQERVRQIREAALKNIRKAIGYEQGQDLVAV